VNGFVQNQYYSGSNCDGDMTLINATPSNTCIPKADAPRTITGNSFKITFDDSKYRFSTYHHHLMQWLFHSTDMCSNLRILVYTDTSCLTYSYMTTFATMVNVCETVTPGTFQSSISRICTVGNEPNVTMPSYNAQRLVSNFYLI
jgi:hypothetical protein